MATLSLFQTALLVTIAGCAALGAGSGQAAPAKTPTPVFPDDTVAPLVSAVPQRTVKPLPTARLAANLLPPTNRWFSGLVFGEPSMPVFPLPLSFKLTTGGFELGLPSVTTAPKVIMGGFTGQLRADVGADSQIVSAYDAASVTISQRSGTTELGTTVIAQGSPFVTFTAAQTIDVAMATAFPPSSKTDGAWTVDAAGTRYGLVSPGTLSDTGTTLSLEKGQTATWFALPTGGSLADFAAAAANPVTGTSLDYGLDGDLASTSIRYQTTGDAPTLVAAMPHQYSSPASGAACDKGTYQSIYGELRVCAVSTLSWSVPALKPNGALDLAALTGEQKATLAEQVRADVAASRPFADDTYFGGKSLYRAANLLGIARQVGADDAAAELTTRLTAAIDEWTQPGGCEKRALRCFVYDPAAKGIVGLAPSFGSDEFNDHHFHYGYFLYAAGVVAADSPELAAKWAPVMNLLAADLATSGASSYFPEQRVFDAYAGHSWASGTSPFGDGNNQESSSEAVSAWNGLALWATASNQPELLTEATWMMSAEAASARAYWTDFPLDAPVYQGFGHTITSLVWGGKRDYATWFSAEPSAMLGILVLPMSPVAGYLGGDPSRIRANIADAAPNGFDVMFGDYLLMYSSLAGPDAAASALDAAKSLADVRIDDGNSRAYLLAFIMAQRAT